MGPSRAGGRYSLAPGCLPASWLLLGVALNLFKPVGIARDFEIEAPVTGDARLPEVRSFVVLLGVQGRVGRS